MKGVLSILFLALALTCGAQVVSSDGTNVVFQLGEAVVPLVEGITSALVAAAVVLVLNFGIYLFYRAVHRSGRYWK
jgi:hypothetical protein